MKQHLENMLCLDLFLSEKIHLSNAKSKSPDIDHNMQLPLISWDIFSDHFFKHLNTSRKLMDLNKIKTYAKKYRWKNDIENLFNSIDFSAIILTDINQKIMWVNEGFTTMTGYTKKEVLDKTPKILQGPKTLQKSKSELAFRIKEDKPFVTTLLNYRKNKSEYNCKVHIVPLYNEETTHYIALEKEVL